ncbi:unnamed protein product [Chrysoparadoxa australica]
MEVCLRGHHCIAKNSDGRKTFVVADGSCQLLKSFGRTKISMGPLVGAPYEAVFEFTGGKLKRVEGTLMLEDGDDKSFGEWKGFNALDTERDNRHVIDDNRAQQLTPEEVKKMQDAGTSGTEIIKALAENSATFQSKTEFSQQKWLAKKSQKYCPRMRLVKCTAETVCEAYQEKKTRQMAGLLGSTLGLILLHSNVYAGCKAMVYDGILGVVLGAVMERMGLQGRVMAPYPGQTLAADAVKKFNFPEETVKQLLIDFPTNMINTYKDESTAGDKVVEVKKEMEKFISIMDKKGDKVTKAAKEKMIKAKKERLARTIERPQPSQIRRWLREQCDSLIIATLDDPLDALTHLIPHLAVGRPFVVYSEFIQPLLPCFEFVKDEGLAVRVRLMDAFYREHQMVPGRTHPKMDMSSLGGFILTGFKVEPPGDKAERPNKDKKRLAGSYQYKKRRQKY